MVINTKQSSVVSALSLNKCNYFFVQCGDNIIFKCLVFKDVDYTLKALKQ